MAASGEVAAAILDLDRIDHLVVCAVTGELDRAAAIADLTSEQV